MLIRDVDELAGSDRHVRWPCWASTRLIAADDGMGFSLHVTRIFAGSTGLTEYPDHVEAAYCVSGHATLVYEDGDRRADIRPGVLYALDRHDRHTMTVHEELLLICVFRPALQGTENANDAGAGARAGPGAVS